MQTPSTWTKVLGAFRNLKKNKELAPGNLNKRISGESAGL